MLRWKPLHVDISGTNTHFMDLISEPWCDGFSHAWKSFNFRWRRAPSVWLMSTGSCKSTQTILGRKRGRRKAVSSVVKNDNPGPPPLLPPPPLPAVVPHPLPATVSSQHSSPIITPNFFSSEADYPEDLDLNRPSSPIPTDDDVVLHSLQRTKRIRVRNASLSITKYW